MTEIPEVLSGVTDIDALLVALRPKLHRYCARMVGSVIDGEDVLQDALIKAVEAFASSGPIDNPEGWLFRIAHNTALDFLRRRKRQEAFHSVAEVDMMADQFSSMKYFGFEPGSFGSNTRIAGCPSTRPGTKCQSLALE